ncbi:MAG: DUF5977 domain-containing protein [Agriterribacter sp.]
MNRCIAGVIIVVMSVMTGFYSRAQEGETVIPPPPLEKPSIPSVEAFSFSKFGEIPVSFYTGSVNIEVPLLNITTGRYQLPIALRYDAGGNRVNEKPGWVGQNWALMAGGVINRHVNGSADEVGFGSNYYFNNYSRLNISNWTNLPYIGDQTELAPDEFSFSVGNISGYFMFDHTGNWIVRCENDPNVKVEFELQTDYNFSYPTTQKITKLNRVIKKFTLTAGDGTRYIFGGLASAIEFTLPALPGKTADYNCCQSPNNKARIAHYCENVQEPGCRYYSAEAVASAWHLAKIISPLGETIDFEYDSQPIFRQNIYSKIGSDYYQWQGTSYTYDVNQPQKYLIATSFIKKITCHPSGITCEFFKAKRNDLSLTELQNPQTATSLFLWGDTNNGFDNNFKLDHILLKFNNKLITNITLRYIENTSERLKLREVLRKSNDNSIREEVYSFKYNLKKLPAYNTGLEDHWGFYNNKNYWNGISKQEVTAKPDKDPYYQSREPDPAYMDAEMISEIRYPTGGVSKFYFEPHQYSQWVLQEPAIQLENLNVNKTAGGMRIRKVETYPFPGSTPMVKEYFYNRNFISSGQLSSGILNSKPYYFSEVQTNYYDWTIKRSFFSSLPLNYINTSGNHIAYSEVVEKSNNGYTVYKYTNYDNGYSDKPPLSQEITDGQSLSYFSAYGKLDLERGKLVKQEIYSDAKILKKEIVNTYNSDSTRYNKYVRSIQYPVLYKYGKIAYTIYSFIPHLEKQVVNEYTDATSANKITNTTEFSYDSRSLLIEKKFLNSKGEALTEKYKYPYNSTEAVYQKMVTNNVVAPVISKALLVNGVQKQAVENQFSEPFTDKFLLKQVNEKLLDNASERVAEITKYNAAGRFLEMIQRDGISEVYLWGYGNMYPVAKIVGSSFDVVNTIVNVELMNDPAVSDAALNSEFSKLRTSNKLKSAFITTYTYVPLIGRKAETDPAGKTVFFEYDDFNRLRLIRDMNNKIVKAFCYGYDGQPVDCNIAGAAVVYKNIRISASFIRKTCRENEISDSVIYTVPAGTFLSTISQADADQQAQNNIQEKGQLFANDTGECRVNPNWCVPANCTGEGKKCVNGICETGQKVVTRKEYLAVPRKYRVTYHYVWSDGSVSQDYTVIQ